MRPGGRDTWDQSTIPADTDESLAPMMVYDAAVADPQEIATVSGWELPSNLAWSVLKNSAAQVGGRVVIVLCRLVVASLIVRTFGKSLFGEYSLILGVLTTADWLVDFGTTEVFVREMRREPQRSERLLRILTATKGIQAPAAFLAVAVMLVTLRYPGNVIRAGLVGAINLLFFAVVLIYRAVFKSTLTMERDVAAEFISVVAMVPVVALACKQGGGLIALSSAYVFSRAVYCIASVLLGKYRFIPSIAGVSLEDVRHGLGSSSAIGVIGFLVGGYETLDLLLLSKLGGFSQLAYYSAAQRLLWPILMALSAVGATFYPIAASYWPDSRVKFESTCQRGIDAVLVLAGLAVVPILAGARFFMGLLGPDLVRGASALKVLAVLCLVKAVTSTVGPILYILKAQNKALRFVGVAVVIKAGVIAALIPRFGYVGVAYGALVVEFWFAAIPAVYLVYRSSGYLVRWNIGIKVACLVFVTSMITRLLPFSGGLMAALLAPVIYLPLVFVTGAARLSEVRMLLDASLTR